MLRKMVQYLKETPEVVQMVIDKKASLVGLTSIERDMVVDALITNKRKQTVAAQENEQKLYWF